VRAMELPSVNGPLARNNRCFVARFAAADGDWRAFLASVHGVLLVSRSELESAMRR